MGRPVVHWEIGAKDSVKMREFYAELFDWKIETAAGDYGMVDTQSQDGIGGGIFPLEHDQPPYVTFYVEVEDLQEYLDKAESMGGRIIVPPTPIPEMGAFAMFSDPEGHVIGLFKTI